MRPTSEPTCRRYGAAPHHLVVVHGGPGAAGEMAPVAAHLAPDWGVLEPVQTALTVPGQIDELATLVVSHGDPPVTLIGYSWGAWLSYLLAATEPTLVKKLILVGCPPFEDSYVDRIRSTRRRRLSDQERAEYDALFAALDDPAAPDRNATVARIGALTSKTDAYNAPPPPSDGIDCRADIFLGVWQEAAALRSDGRLLTYAAGIRCPVVALHGDYDPHPAEGVERPLSRLFTGFRLTLLDHCGHKPWVEREASANFYDELRAEIERPVPER